MGSITLRSCVVIATLVIAVTGAAADRPSRIEPAPAAKIAAAPLLTPMAATATTAPRPQTIGEEFDARLTRLETQIATLELDAIELRFDKRTRHAHLLVRGDTSLVSFRLSSDISLRRGAAAIDARLEVAVAGHRLAIALPDVELAPRSYLGERYLEVRVPFVRRTF